MKIDIYIGQNAPGWSLYMLGHDIASELKGNVCVVTGLSNLRAGAVILNLVLEQVGIIEKARRFTGIGPQVCLFAGNTEDYTEEELIGHLIQCTKIPLIVHSQDHYDKVVKAVKNWLSPMRAKKFINQNLSLIWGGVLKGFTPGDTPKTLKFIVPYNRVNQSQKNMTAHYEVSEAVDAMLRLKYKVTVDHDFLLRDDGSIDRLEEIDKNDIYDPITQVVDRAEYQKLCREYCVAICTSNYESLGLMYLELLMSGVVVVFLDRPWVRKLLPDYKYVASRDALPKLAYSVALNYPKAREYVLNTVCDFILHERSHEKFCARVSKLLAKLERGDSHERGRENEKLSPKDVAG